MAQLKNIADIRRYLEKQAAEKLIHAFVGSRLDYCSSLLVGNPEISLAKLQRVQNIAARILTGTRKCDHMTPLLYKLHWLPFKYRIEYKIILMTYRALNGLAPNYLQDWLQVYQPARSLRSSGDLKLVVPRTRLRSYGDREFSVKAPSLWNSLPLHMRIMSSMSTFKKVLKTHIFQMAFADV